MALTGIGWVVFFCILRDGCEREIERETETQW